MLDYVCIFTTGGVLLWQQKFIPEFNINLINLFVKTCLLEEKYQSQERKYTHLDYQLKWQIDQSLKLVFAVVYKEILQLALIDQLIGMISKVFIGSIYPIIKQDDGVFDLGSNNDDIFGPQYLIIYQKWDTLVRSQQQAPKKMRTFDETQKGKKLKRDQTLQTQLLPNKDKPKQVAEQSPSPTDEIQDARLRLKKRFLNTTPTKKIQEKEEDSDSDKANETKKEIKSGRVWHTINTKINKKSMDKFDLSTNKDQSPEDLQAVMDMYLGGDDDVMQGFLDSDDDSMPMFDSINPLKSQEQQKSIFGRLTSAFQSVTGNKQLTREDMDPILRQFAQQLMDKNVAQDVANQICRQVEASLLDQRTQTFTSVKQTIKTALTDVIGKLLTPKQNIDILKDALAAKRRGQVFSIAFIGVNGVGKSTSLAKMAYYLKTKGNLKVMLAGCDNFRSGAIEQLATHAACLNIPLYEKGYKDDPAIIAKEALQEARTKHFDVVLIDTAGRMQGNDKLMRELARLVHLNAPDIVLFVGEALVGNDAIDQLTKFNQSLIDFAVSQTNPRTIDGIILTKFDTVDEKVGTALNMVQSTGKPIVFVGVGQKYPHLKKLNVPTVINALMS